MLNGCAGPATATSVPAPTAAETPAKDPVEKPAADDAVPADAAIPSAPAAPTTSAGNSPSRFDEPVLASDAPPELRSFHEAAARAVRRVFDEDFADPAILLNLGDQLATRPELASAAMTWGPWLALAIERAEKLQRLEAVNRHVRRAFAQAKPSGNGIFRDLDYPACRMGFSLLFDSATDAVETEIHLEGLGAKTLHQLNAICQASYAAELAETRFPGPAGSPELRQLVRDLYGEALTVGKLRRVSVPQSWAVSGDAQTRTLTAFAGVERAGVFPEDSCVIEELVLTQSKSGNEYGATRCCDLVRTRPIACAQLRPAAAPTPSGEAARAPTTP